MHSKFLRGGLIIFALFFFIGCYDGEYDDLPAIEPIDITANMSAATLRTLMGSAEYIDIIDDWVIKGVVTADDKDNNFYNYLVMQDGEVGIALMTGLYNDYVEHEEGSVVAIFLKGLRIVRNRGVMMIGRAPSWGGDSSYDVEYLGSQIVVDMHLQNLGYRATVEPLVLSASTLSSASDDFIESLCGRLVTIEGVSFALELVSDWSYSEAERDRWVGTKPFVAYGESDESNDDIVLLSYSTSYSTFANVTIPAGELSLTGIMQCESYTESGALLPEIKMRSKEDCR